MHSSQKVIHTEIGDDDRKECTHHVDMVAMRLLEKNDRCFVQRHGVDHKCDKCP